MNTVNRLNLERMIKENDVVDCTHDIRQKNHSQSIRDDVTRIITIKKDNPNIPHEELDKICVSSANFLFVQYTDIYNKVLKNEINLTILWKMLDAMRKIETGETDQHNAAYEVGDLLKKIYIDSAVRKADKLNKKNIATSRDRVKNITWKQYKFDNQ